MKKILLCALALLAGCASEDILLRPLPAAGEPSTEVTVIRPRSTVLAEWPVYIVVADQPVFDLRNGEHTRFRVSSGRGSLTIRCTSGIDKAKDVRVEQEFAPRGAAYFVVEPKGDCVSITPVAAGDAVRGTRFRAMGTVNAAAQATGDAPAVFTTKPAPPAEKPAPAEPAKSASAAPNEGVAAATKAWVEAFNSRDMARIASLYEPDAVLRDASGQRIAAGPAAIARYLRDAKRPTQLSISEQEIRVFGETAVDNGVNTLGHYTIVYRNRGGRWLIVDQNISAAK